MSQVYRIVLEHILAELEKGVVPWRKPWKVDGLAPTSLASRRPYRGINVFLLAARGASTPWWLTFRQVQDLGGRIRRGESHTKVVLWRWVDSREEAATEGELATPRRSRRPLLRYYRVFNLDQTEGIPAERIPRLEAPPRVLRAEEVVAGFAGGPTLRHRIGDCAGYSPLSDTVTLPPIEAFATTAGYYGTLFHECVHATGHAKRLARPAFERNLVAPKGSDEYAREELVAELGAAFLCGEAGVEPDLDQSAAYLEGWRSKISRNPRLLLTAAQQAQRAADLILGRDAEELPVAASVAA